MEFDLLRAIERNRVYARNLGWGSRRAEIAAFLGLHGRSPSEEEFANAVWQWQRGQAGLAADGILGRASWQRLAYQLDNLSSGSVRSWSHGAMRGTLLTGFDFDDTTLKPQHERWLAGFASDTLRNTAGEIYIIGLTDRSGSESYNRALSRRRATQVFRFLQQYGRSSIPIYVAGVGESLAGATSERAASDRGVAVIYNVVPQPPPPWLRQALMPQPTRIFYIRAVAAMAVGVGVPDSPLGISSIRMTMQISDGFWSNFYSLEMAGFGASASRDVLPIGVSVNDVGPWHLFRIREPRTVNDFNGTNALFANVGFSAPFGTGGVSRMAVQFHNPTFRIEPFELGPGLSTSIVSISGEAGGGGLSRVTSHAVQRGVRGRIQRHLRSGGDAGDDSMQPIR